MVARLGILVRVRSGHARRRLLLSWHDNRLEFSAPRVHFLTGKPLDRLHNAADVPFDFQITLWSDTHSHLFNRTAARFVVSYDVWEETFSVMKLQTPRKMASHLTDRAAEAWCLSQLPVDVAGLDDAQKFWARLEIRAQDGKEARHCLDAATSVIRASTSPA